MEFIPGEIILHSDHDHQSNSHGQPEPEDMDEGAEFISPNGSDGRSQVALEHMI